MISMWYRRFMLLVVLAGCETVAERVVKLSSSKAEDRLEAVAAMTETIAAAEEERAETDAPLGNPARDYLAVLGKLAFEDADPHVRAAALAFLGESPSWKDISLFRGALDDSQWRCQYEALHALRLRGDPPSIPRVMALLERSTETLVRLEAILFLREHKAREAIPVLVRIVTNLLERNQLGFAAWLALKELSGQEFSSENFLGWEAWYRSYAEGAAKASSQDSPSGDGSPPAAGNGDAGGAPPAKR
jgi:HEAT repeat protein